MSAVTWKSLSKCGIVRIRTAAPASALAVVDVQVDDFDVAEQLIIEFGVTLLPGGEPDFGVYADPAAVAPT